MSPTDLAYAAGIIDGEAHVGIERKRANGQRKNPSHTPRLVVSVVDEALVRWFQAQFGGNVRSVPARGSGTRTVHIWYVSSRAAVHVLELVSPYLKIKRPHAALIIDFHRRRTNPCRRGLSTQELAMRDTYYDAVRRLNYGPRAASAA
jgi:hypothetical protein